LPKVQNFLASPKHASSNYYSELIVEHSLQPECKAASKSSISPPRIMYGEEQINKTNYNLSFKTYKQQF